MAPPPTQPLGKLDGLAKTAAAGRRSTAAELLQEKYNVKVLLVALSWSAAVCFLFRTHLALLHPAGASCCCSHKAHWSQAVQESENDKAEIVIVCEPEGMSLQMGGLHPRASLYEKPVNLEAAKQAGGGRQHWQHQAASPCGVCRMWLRRGRCRGCPL